MRGKPFLAGRSKGDLGYVLMEYTGSEEERQKWYRAPSGRRYSFRNQALEENEDWVHPMDMNYLRTFYPIRKVPWRGVA